MSNVQGKRRIDNHEIHEHARNGIERDLVLSILIILSRKMADTYGMFPRLSGKGFGRRNRSLRNRIVYLRRLNRGRSERKT
jgi:hypothetical protein